MAETEWGKCKDCKWVQIELDAVEASTSSDDADNSKPDPDIVHAALERIGLPVPVAPHLTVHVIGSFSVSRCGGGCR
jgi:hypothetical protein